MLQYLSKLTEPNSLSVDQNQMTETKITVIPGDGIGPEIMDHGGSLMEMVIMQLLILLIIAPVIMIMKHPLKFQTTLIYLIIPLILSQREETI